jgi:hypothetical protein
MNGRRVDVTIEIPRMSLVVWMYNAAQESEPQQVPSNVDEGAGARCSGAVPRGSIFRSPSSPVTNINDPKVNWVLRENFTSKLQGTMVFSDGS